MTTDNLNEIKRNHVLEEAMCKYQPQRVGIQTL